MASKTENTQHLTISTMTVSELDTVLDWAGDEGWNPGLADAAAFLAADPAGFFMARIEGDPVAAISVVNHGPDQAFLGLYICRPDWRGQGIGMATWTHAMAHAGMRTIGLDGVAEQEANYQLSGFKRTGSSLRHEGRWEARASSDVHAFHPDHMSDLIDLDTQAGGFGRPTFLRAWLAPVGSERNTRVLIQSGDITGFATWRACRTGTKIGPLIAPDTKAALTLIADVAAIRPDGPLIIDLPEANTDLRRILESAGFVVPFATARMYRGRPPVTHASLQAIATMELG